MHRHLLIFNARTYTSHHMSPRGMGHYLLNRPSLPQRREITILLERLKPCNPGQAVCNIFAAVNASGTNESVANVSQVLVPVEAALLPVTLGLQKTTPTTPRRTCRNTRVVNLRLRFDPTLRQYQLILDAAARPTFKTRRVHPVAVLSRRMPATSVARARAKPSSGLFRLQLGFGGWGRNRLRIEFESSM